MKKLSGKPFVLLGVNSDPDLIALRKTLIDEPITWRSWWDEGRTDGPIHTTWQVQQRPCVHLIDHKGVIRYKNIQADDLDAAIDGLLAEAAAEQP